MRGATYSHPHNYMVRELDRHQGNDLNFLGVVSGRGWQDSPWLKERQGWMMAQVAIVIAGIGSTIQPSIAEDPRDASGPLQVGCWYGAI